VDAVVCRSWPRAGTELRNARPRNINGFAIIAFKVKKFFPLDQAKPGAVQSRQLQIRKRGQGRKEGVEDG